MYIGCGQQNGEEILQMTYKMQKGKPNMME
jgi:hypothetical protein